MKLVPHCDDRIPAYTAQLQAYMAAVDELTAAGQNATTIPRLSPCR